jgi:hypothetical protein
MLMVVDFALEQMDPIEGLDENWHRGEIVAVRTGRALALMAMLAVQATCVPGARRRYIAHRAYVTCSL